MTTKSALSPVINNAITLNHSCDTRIGPALKVWWIPQIGAPIPRFEVLVNSFAEAKVLLGCLAQYDLFQWENKIKPNYSNTGGLMCASRDCDGGDEYDGWEDWETDDGDDFRTVSLAECVEMDRAFYNRQLDRASRGIKEATP